MLYFNTHVGATLQWEVLVRIDAMRREADRAERKRQEVKSQQQDRPRTREPNRAPEQEPQQEQEVSLSR